MPSFVKSLFHLYNRRAIQCSKSCLFQILIRLVHMFSTIRRMQYASLVYILVASPVYILVSFVCLSMRQLVILKLLGHNELKFEIAFRFGERESADAEDFAKYLKTEHYDPRLNEILYPAPNLQVAQALISEVNKGSKSVYLSDTLAGYFI